MIYINELARATCRLEWEYFLNEYVLPTTIAIFSALYEHAMHIDRCNNGYVLQLRVVDPVPADPDCGGVCDVLPRVDPLEAALLALRLRHPLRRLLLRSLRPVRAHDVSGKNEVRSKN